ncbi:hypothetical protein TNIN_199701 [Trichonephila inaurata madagascariensis]|uniref:Uncharacterized protein n=1 Tax=Trichonephila inaurata madagascariensis TaxID=2747483 RepID=A0A8X6XD71_9ARAC|nr:hypothetical protein TNIN_199701 [Trichonephila inaurata madagascariensis]
MKSLLLVVLLMACMMAFSFSEETFRLKRQSGGNGKLIGVDLCIPLSLSSDVLGQLLGILLSSRLPVPKTNICFKMKPFWIAFSWTVILLVFIQINEGNARRFKRSPMPAVWGSNKRFVRSPQMGDTMPPMDDTDNNMPTGDTDDNMPTGDTDDNMPMDSMDDNDSNDGMSMDPDDSSDSNDNSDGGQSFIGWLFSPITGIFSWLGGLF